MIRPTKPTIGTAANGMYASGPAIRLIIQIKKKINGKSTTAIKVAEVKNSLSVSNSLTTLAIAPDFGDRRSQTQV